MRQSDKIDEYLIYSVEFKCPKGKLWHLWDSGIISTNREMVEEEGEKWWGKDGHGRSGYKYRIATFKRI